MPRVAEMRAALARTLGVDPSCVSVKATTTDGLGAIGRGEGIEAQAIALIEERVSP
jgi:2-C-methyl-D-erythritol 2,4-cyclodiphosphate synthase